MKMADFSGLAAQTERLEALLDGEALSAVLYAFKACQVLQAVCQQSEPSNLATVACSFKKPPHWSNEAASEHKPYLYGSLSLSQHGHQACVFTSTVPASTADVLLQPERLNVSMQPCIAAVQVHVAAVHGI